MAYAHEKKLSDEDLKNKREGFYATGIFELSADPLNGFGDGAEGSLCFNGKKTDLFFSYAPRQLSAFLIFQNHSNNPKRGRVIRYK